MALTIWLFPTLFWALVLLLPWQPWRVRERIEPASNRAADDVTDIDVLIPARNEAEHLTRTLEALGKQGNGLRIVLVDDQSQDDTLAVARQWAGPEDVIVQGEALPRGWSGKLWALEQGRAHLQRPITLLLDADISLLPGMVEGLRAKLLDESRDLVSVMARLSTRGGWARLLIPAFVYYFKILYPFTLANDDRHRGIAAAAGGCIMLRKTALDEIGGFASIRHALIDDCALARRLKQHGFRIWIGLSEGVVSERSYARFAAIAEMIRRTAFTQLRHSMSLLLLLSALFGWIYVVPLIGLWQGKITTVLSALALMAMWASYVPTLRFYRLSAMWSLLLPLVGLVYLVLTWYSALCHWRGQGSRWRGRQYTVNAGEVEQSQQGQ